MNKINVFVAIIFILISTVSYSGTKIDSQDAPFHQGKDVTACGIVKEVSRFKRGYYLNMDDFYPKQSLTLVIWENDLAEFTERHGSLSNLTNKLVCGRGIVNEYRGRHQISLYNSYSLQIQTV